MQLTQGQKLNERYQIIKKLGDGSFGETYLAEDKWQEDNRCVVKRLKPEMINPLTLRLFKHEAKSLTQLGKHDQIPELFAHFQEDDEFYLVQEFIEGHDLTKEIESGKYLSESSVIHLLEDILKILIFVHENNVIHRDIKPANIMRRKKDGKIVLIDFGGIKQVKAQSKSTVLTPVVGTRGYMPDEQWRNQAQLCSDIYAVGMMAIEALTGLQPLQLQRDGRTGELRWHDRAKVSQGFAEVLDKMVEFHFENRYQSADEALEALQIVANRFQSALCWLQRGDKFVELKEYEKGVEAYEKAIGINEYFYQAFYHRGIALKQLNRHKEAIASYDEAIKIINSEQAWYSRGLSSTELGLYEKAIISYERATEIRPDYYQAWYHRGIALHKIFQYRDAIASYDQAIQIKKDYFEAWTGRGIGLRELEKNKEALISYNKALSIRPAYQLAIEKRKIVLKLLVIRYIVYPFLLLVIPLLLLKLELSSIVYIVFCIIAYILLFWRYLKR
jgi:eukaryotic-like serine/threonine-protein kinase